MALITTGDGSFSRIRKRWVMSDFGLDTLIESWQGAKSGLDTYLGTLTKWQSNDIDSNMFLASWDDDDDPVKPTVELRYVGCRNGDTDSRTRNESGSATQTVEWSDSGSEVTLTYIGPTVTRYAITRSFDAVVDPPSFPPGHETAAVTYHYSLLDPPYTAPIGSLEAVFLYLLGTFFDTQTVVRRASKEIVQGQYYQASTSVAVEVQPKS